MLQFLLFQLCPESKYPLISNFVQSPILITCVCMSVICTERKCSEENVSVMLGVYFKLISLVFFLSCNI